jgi:hypothetical protein
MRKTARIANGTLALMLTKSAPFKGPLEALSLTPMTLSTPTQKLLDGPR